VLLRGMLAGIVAMTAIAECGSTCGMGPRPAVGRVAGAGGIGRTAFCFQPQQHGLQQGPVTNPCQAVVVCWSHTIPLVLALLACLQRFDSQHPCIHPFQLHDGVRVASHMRVVCRAGLLCTVMVTTAWKLLGHLLEGWEATNPAQRACSPILYDREREREREGYAQADHRGLGAGCVGRRKG
jgi:hypothetical protein